MLQSLLITRPGIEVAKYVGRYGWISVDESALQDDDELRHLVALSYDLIAKGAPRRTASKKKAAKK